MADKKPGILSRVRSVLVGAVKILPVIAGASSPFVKKLPSGRRMAMSGQHYMNNWGDLLYDLKELFTGMDDNGKFHGDWLISTYLPVFTGIGASRLVDEVI